MVSGPSSVVKIHADVDPGILGCRLKALAINNSVSQSCRWGTLKAKDIEGLSKPLGDEKHSPPAVIGPQTGDDRWVVL
jgi:hypothetical protein